MKNRGTLRKKDRFHTNFVQGFSSLYTKGAGTYHNRTLHLILLNISTNRNRIVSFSKSEHPLEVDVKGRNNEAMTACCKNQSIVFKLFPSSKH